MRLFLLFVFIMLCQRAFADRLGSLRSNADVLLTTQAVSGNSLPFLSSTSSDTISSADLEFNSSSIGPVFTDSSNCTWRTTITTAGNLVTSLIRCPTIIAARPCTTGMSLGLLLGITCP